MKISEIILNMSKTKQITIVGEYQNEILDYYFNNIYSTPTQLKSFILYNLLDKLNSNLNKLINDDKFNLFNIIKTIKHSVYSKAISTVKDEFNKDKYYYFFKVMFEKKVLDDYLEKQYNPIIEMIKIKDYVLPLLYKHKKKTQFLYAKEEVVNKANRLKLVNNQKSQYLKLNEKYEKFNYFNDEVLNLSDLFNENSFTTIKDVSQIINNNPKLKYIYLPNDFTKASNLNQIGVYRITKDIIKQIKRKDVYYLVAPRANGYNKTLYWWHFINELNMPNIKTAIILRNYEDIYEVEKNPLVDLIIINYDDISKKSTTLEKFKESSEQKLRFIKHVAKENKIEVAIKSTNLKEESVIEKLIIMGFRMFHYNDNHYKHVENSVLNYMSRRGKYKTKKTKQ